MKRVLSMRKWTSVFRFSPRYSALGTVFLLLLLAACGPASSEALPTAVDLNAFSTNDAATQQAQAVVSANATATRIADATLNAPSTLPPTWTAAPQPTEPSAQAS